MKLPVSYSLGPEIDTVLLLAFPVGQVGHRAPSVKRTLIHLSVQRVANDSRSPFSLL